MMSALRRIQQVTRHIHQSRCAYSTFSTPSISVDPSTALIDEKVDIYVNGLKPQQTVTLVARTEENKYMFESRCVMRADTNGRLNNNQHPSIDGTFTGIHPMGLFWSLKSSSGVRLVKKDVSSPISYTINMYDGALPEGAIANEMPLATTDAHRFFKKLGVKRIRLKDGKVKGTMFVPEGDGPFPALVDMFGGIVSLIETRAALLASHGYATLALSYLYGEGLPQNILGADLNYIHDSTKWFLEQEFVDKKRLGAIGLCFGGTLTLALSSICPEVRVVININGLPIYSEHSIESYKDKDWPYTSRVYCTDEGVVINEVYSDENADVIQAWQHGAKVLEVSGLDDKQVHPKWHPLYERQWPDNFKSNFELVTYPGAGHLIEPPYMPLIRAVAPGRARMSTIDFIPPEFHDAPLMAGGYPVQHAFAQEDSWHRILKFLDKNLKKLKD